MFTIQFISAARAPPCVAPHPIMQLLLQCGDSRRILFQPALQVVIDFVRVAFGDTVEAYIVQWKRIWWILCSVCISTLWIQLNRVVHEQFNFHSRGVSERFALMASATTSVVGAGAPKATFKGARHPSMAVRRDTRRQHCAFQSITSCGEPRTTTGPFDTGVANLD